ncbi:MAG: PEGA domain-containing protein [Candidatus Shapirobacteria bacterium]|nr:PEGA domain-containing protein [Candidatus Shapirobacteria bacterium]MDD4410098.1 PEGA domain-containing protein [Candidatus Shapirobacteria bacterium]
MLKKFLVLILASIFLSSCSLSPKKSGLEIMSFPIAKVYVNNKEMGSTPYKNMNLKPGENEVKLISGNKEWKRKIDLQNNINTVVDWQFGDDSNGDSGYVLYLEKTGDKKASLLVNTNPDKATITIDGEVKGISPIKVSEIGEGDKQLSVSFPGYKDINIFMKAINGYQLVVSAKLATEKNNIDQIISSSENETPVNSLNVAKKITIKETETGWLKVREASSSSSKEVTRIKPGEQYVLIEEGTDWDKIDLGNGKNGWISTTYASKN